MESLSIGKDETVHLKRENECSVLHRRSRSASDKNVDISRFGAPYSSECSHNLSLDSPFSTRTCGSQTTPNAQSIDSSTSSSYHRASLEKDVHLLQSRLQQEKAMRNMLEKAIGRASSALSPGHRHFASQTKELIAEIELLEEEVANREQHVLDLYRNIFEQCVSQPSSVQNSGMSSPLHTKNKVRKHPSIISSAFCSSKKFPLRAFSSKSTSGKKEGKIRHASLCKGKIDIHYEKPCSKQMKFQVHGKSLERVKNSDVRTLKDYLYQCPSKLSEEMVKSMAAVYCWFCRVASTESKNSENTHSSVVSKSCEDVSLQLGNQKKHAVRSIVEISSLPTNRKQFSRASYAINSYRALVEQLEKVDVSHMEAKARLAFWINIYNSLIMHAYLAYGIPNSSLRRLALFHKAAYNIGGIVVTANAIEHTIFCFRTPRNGGWIETFLSTAFRKKYEDKQLLGSKVSLPDSKSLVCFALCTGAFSDPVLKVYTAANVREELEQAKREFLRTNIVVKNSKKVVLPKMLERFSREASLGSEAILKWVCQNVDRKMQDSIQQCFASKYGKKASQIIEWLPYSSKFRYAFSEGLASKPWWV